METSLRNFRIEKVPSSDATAVKRTLGSEYEGGHPEYNGFLPEDDFYCKLCGIDCVNNTGKLLHSLDANHTEAFLKSLKVSSKKSHSFQRKSYSNSNVVTTSPSLALDPGGQLSVCSTKINNSLAVQRDQEHTESIQNSESGSSKDNAMNGGLNDEKTEACSVPFNPSRPCRRITIEGIFDKTGRRMIIRQFAKYGLIKSSTFIGATAHIEYMDRHSVERILAEQAQQKMTVNGKEIQIKKSGTSLKKALQIGKIPENVRILLSSEEIFLNQLDGFLESFQLSSSDIEKQQVACQSVFTSLKYFSPKVYPYGSRITGLSSKDSDLDIFVEITQPYRYASSKYQRSTQELIIHDAAQDIKCSREFSNVVQIPQANVPLLSCVHMLTGLKCDLTFRYPYQVHNTRLIRFYLSIDHRVRPLILLIRYWAKAHGLAGRGKFSSYSLSLMCMFYLQQIPNKPVLPSVSHLMKLAKDDERASYDHWDCGFSEDMSLIPESLNDSSLFHHVKGFFKYFSEFNRNNMVVCPFLGKPVHKNIFHPGMEKHLPVEFEKYKSNCMKGLKEPLRVDHVLCIQDPFVHNSNVAAQSRVYIVDRFQILCDFYGN